MITVKAFSEVNITIETRYVVFCGGEVLDYFILKYLDDKWNRFAEACKKLRALESNPKAYVKHVDLHEDQLQVTVEIKQ